MMVRVKFAKYGRCALPDIWMCCAFFRKRSAEPDWDVVYTHGFNPHQAQSFARHWVSDCAAWANIWTWKSLRLMAQEDFKERLQEACPYGIDILSVKMLPEKAGKRDGERRCGNLCSSI